MKPETIFAINLNEVRYAKYYYEEGWDTELSYREEYHKVWIVFIDGSTQNIYFESKETANDFIDWIKENLNEKPNKK